MHWTALITILSARRVTIRPRLSLAFTFPQAQPLFPALGVALFASEFYTDGMVLYIFVFLPFFGLEAREITQFEPGLILKPVFSIIRSSLPFLVIE